MLFGTPRHSWPRFGQVRNPLIPRWSGIAQLAARYVQECRAELVIGGLLIEQIQEVFPDPKPITHHSHNRHQESASKAPRGGLAFEAGIRIQHRLLETISRDCSSE
jgi:hypothetical protein